MTEMNIFEVASRSKMRFNYKGIISVEDLWDLNEKELNDIYVDIMTKLKKTEEIGLLGSRSKDYDILNIQSQIVVHIFTTKKSEKEERVLAAEKLSKKRKIMEIIATKKDEALSNSSIEDLEKMLGEM